MNFKTTGILVALLAVAGIVWMFTPTRKDKVVEEKPSTAAADDLKPVLEGAPAAADVTRITFEVAGRPKLVFERVTDSGEANDWRVVEPLSAKAEGFGVSDLANRFLQLKSRTRFEAGSAGGISLADAGLAPPQAVLTFATAEGKETKIAIGNKAPMSTDTYVQAPGQKTVEVVAQDLSHYLKKELKDFRDKRLLTFKADEVKSLKIAFEGRTYELSRGADKLWSLDAPVNALADSTKINALVSRLSGVRISEFADDAPASLAAFGLAPPYLAVSLTTETRKALPTTQPADTQASQPAPPQFETITHDYALEIGGFATLKKDERFVKHGDQPWVATIKETDVAALLPKLSEWRDPQVTRVRSGDVAEFTLTTPQGSATLRNEGGRWVGTDDLAEPDAAAIASLLEAFEDLKAVQYVEKIDDATKLGFENPRAKLTVTPRGGAPVTVIVGNDTESGRNTYLQRVGQPDIIVATAAQAGRLAVTPLSLRTRTIFALGAEQIRKLEIDRGGSIRRVIRAGDAWQLEEPAAPLDAASIRVLVNDLARLQSKNVVAKGEHAKYGLDQPTLTVRFEVAPPATTAPAEAPAAGPTTHTLRVARAGPGVYAAKDDDPFVFELDESVFRTLSSELIEPKLFRFAGSDISGLKIVAPGGTLEFVLEADQWKFAPDPYVAISQKRTKELMDDVAALRAEQFVAWADGDLAAAGLENTPVTIEIRLKQGEPVTLKVAQETAGQLPRLAALVGERRILRLRNADVEKLLRGLDEYTKPDAPATPQPGGPFPPPGGPFPPPGQ